VQAEKAFETAADTYFMANDAASYDDRKRARAHWNYFRESPTLRLLVGALFLIRPSVEWHARFSMRSSVLQSTHQFFDAHFSALFFSYPSLVCVVLSVGFERRFASLSRTDYLRADDRK